MQTAGNATASQRGSFHVPRIFRRTVLWLMWCVAIISLILVVYNFVVWPWISRWGATPAEATRALPGDELVANPIIVTTKAVTIQATPEQIWPWLLQLGVDRGGMYSYLWVENWLLRLNVSNTDVLYPAWQEMAVGDFIRFTPKDYPLNPGPGLYVLLLEPERALAGCFGLEDSPVDCNQAATWQFVIEPETAQTTRLILRSRSPGTSTPTMLLTNKIAGAFQFYMERKMLLALKARAESPAVGHTVAQ